MLSIYLFFLAAKIGATLGCAFIAWRVSRIPGTPTGTYRLFTSAFVLALATQIHALVRIQPVTEFFSLFNLSEVILSQMMACGIFVLILIGLIRKYAALHATGLTKQ